MKIRIKIFLSFFIVVFITTMVGVAVTNFFARSAVTNLVLDHLDTVAHAEAQYVEGYLSSLQEQMVNFSSDGKIKDCLHSINNNITGGCSPEELVSHLIKNKLQVVDNFVEVSILDTAGLVVASTSEGEMGLSKRNEEYFSNSLGDPHIGGPRYSEELQQYLLIVTTPIQIVTGVGEIMGTVLGKVGTERINKTLLIRAGLGQTGEALLVYRDKGGNAVFFSPRRFGRAATTRDTILKEEVNVPAIQALLKNETILPGSIDYRGERVLAATQYVDLIDWGLVVKIDESEAFAPIKALLVLSFGIGFGLLLFILLVVYILGRLIVNPLEKLHRNAEIVAKGNLNFSVGIESKDEIGQLSRAIDKMVLVIKKSRMEVYKKVEEQTRDILESEKLLKDQQKAILNILEDVQEEKNRAEWEKGRTGAILQGIGDGVVFIDENLRIVIFNPIAEKISGVLAKDAIGKRYDNVLRFIHEKTGKVNNKFVKDAFRTGKITLMSNHTRLVRKDGIRIPVSDSAAPLKNNDGRVVGCIVVFRDITKEYEIDKAKTEFVSLASHQLRTPPTTIKWYTEMLLDEEVGKINDRQGHYLKEIVRSNERMIDLVGALLSVSRIEMGTFVVNPKLSDILLIVDGTLREFLSQIKNKRLKIIKRLDKTIKKINVDPNLTQIIIQNLLSNAIKYTPAGGSINLTAKKQKTNILIKISDTGYGIPKNQQSKIFTKLFRADNIRQKDTEGTGLGLYIVKSIVDKAGGKVWFKSELNKGTTFYVTIPLGGMKGKKGVKILS